MSTVKYELKSRTKGFKWQLFDTYSDLDNPDIKKFAEKLGSMKYSDGVKLIKVETIRTEVEI